MSPSTAYYTSNVYCTSPIKTNVRQTSTNDHQKQPIGGSLAPTSGLLMMIPATGLSTRCFCTLH